MPEILTSTLGSKLLEAISARAITLSLPISKLRVVTTKSAKPATDVPTLIDCTPDFLASGSFGVLSPGS